MARILLKNRHIFTLINRTLSFWHSNSAMQSWFLLASKRQDCPSSACCQRASTLCPQTCVLGRAHIWPDLHIMHLWAFPAVNFCWVSVFALAAVEANSVLGWISRLTSKLTEVIFSLYLALVKLHPRYFAQFEALQYQKECSAEGPRMCWGTWWGWGSCTHSAGEGKAPGWPKSCL